MTENNKVTQLLAAVAAMHGHSGYLHTLPTAEQLLMLILVLTIVLVLICTLSAASLATAWQLRRFTHGLTYEPTPQMGDLPLTSVIVPCKGDDGTLNENLHSIVTQRHSNIEFIFVTATDDDPACAALSRLQQQFPQKRIKTVVAGIREHCSQQNNNQVQGVTATDPDSRVIVIMDSDGRADAHFVAKLTAPLSNEKVGAVSGFRWYEPRWSRFADVMRTIWNAGGFTYIINPQSGFVWGGAMAFHRSVYEQAGIADLWSRTLSDDMTLSRRLRSMGLRLHFAPQCIIVSRQPDSLRSLLSWTNRQTLVTRFYNRPFWLLATVFHGCGNVLGWCLLATGVLTLCVGFAGVPAVATHLALLGGVVWVGHLWLMAALMVNPLNCLLKPQGIALNRSRWILIAMAPLASLLQGLNSACSLSTRRIHWAGITYEINSQERMRVLCQ